MFWMLRLKSVGTFFFGLETTVHLFKIESAGRCYCSLEWCVCKNIIQCWKEEIIRTDHSHDRYRLRRVPFKLLYDGSTLLVLYLSWPWSVRTISSAASATTFATTSTTPSAICIFYWDWIDVLHDRCFGCFDLNQSVLFFSLVTTVRLYRLVSSGRCYCSLEWSACTIILQCWKAQILLYLIWNIISQWSVLYLRTN